MRLQLVSEDDELWMTCATVQGLFAPRKDNPEWRRLTLEEGRPAGIVAEYCSRQAQNELQLNNAELRLLGSSNEVIGSYFVSTPVITGRTSSESGLISITGDFLLWDPPPVDAAQIWDQWHTAFPDRPNLWTTLNAAGRHAWLHVTRNHSRWDKRRLDLNSAAQDRVYEIDGSLIVDETSFYIALGEALIGPGGYFGAGLDGLNDCLNDYFSMAPALNITLLNSTNITTLPAVSRILDFLHKKRVNVRVA